MRIAFALFYSLFFIHSAAFAEGALTPNMVGFNFHGEDFTGQATFGQYEDVNELNKVIQGFKAEVAKQKRKGGNVQTVISWMDISEQNRAPDGITSDQMEKPFAVASEAANGIADADVDEIKISSEQKSKILKNFGSFFTPRRTVVGIAILRFSFIAGNQVLSLIAFNVPAPIIMGSISTVIAACAFTAIENLPINNLTNRGIYTRKILPPVASEESDEMERKLSTLKDPSSRFEIVLKNLGKAIRNPSVSARYIRFGICEGLFYILAASGGYIFDLPHYTEVPYTIESAALAVILATAFQNTWDIATNKFMEWATLYGIKDSTIKTLVDGAGLVGSVLSVTGALFLGGQSKITGGAILFSLGAMGATAWAFFGYHCNKLMNGKRAEPKVETLPPQSHGYNSRRWLNLRYMYSFRDRIMFA